MGRQKITPGTVGPVAVVPLAFDSEGTEVVIPKPEVDGEKRDYPRGLKVGQPVKIETPQGVLEFVPSRWRGLARAVDLDGTTNMPRRWRDTKAAAEAATRQAGEEWLRARAQERAVAAAPDATTVTDLLNRWRLLMNDPSNKLHDKSRDDYETTIRAMLGEPMRPLRTKEGVVGTPRQRTGARLALRDGFCMIAMCRPADVDVAMLKGMFRKMADTNGSGTAIRVRTILSHVWDLAMEDSDLDVQVNSVRALSGTESNPVIPKRVKDPNDLDHRRAPTAEEYRSLVAALATDPEAGPRLPGAPRLKSKHGAAGTGPRNPKDIRDLVMLLFATGARKGELLALRWSDLTLTSDDAAVSITATLTYTPEVGTRRTDTKTKGSTRVVYLIPAVATMLRQRALLFGVDLANPPEIPVFGTPGKPEKFRDSAGVDRAIREIFNRHGLTWGRSHTGRKFEVKHLIREGVPLTEIAKIMGWSDILTVKKYADTAAAISADTMAAMRRSAVSIIITNPSADG